jgi:hypothetical protein
VIRGRTEELERLAVEMYARGLLVRDIEAAFTDEAGRCLLSRTAASELTERLWADCEPASARLGYQRCYKVLVSAPSVKRSSRRLMQASGRVRKPVLDGVEYQVDPPIDPELAVDRA